MGTIGKELSLTWTDVWLGIVSGIGIYLTVVILTRIFGQRTLSSVSSFDFPVTVAIGAIVGRTALIRSSLLGGVLALATLFSVQALVGVLRHRTKIGKAVDNRPIPVMADGRFLDDNLRRAHLDREALLEKLRLNGVTHLSQVKVMVLERSGDLSVLKGDGVDRALLRDVPMDGVGAALIRAEEGAG